MSHRPSPSVPVLLLVFAMLRPAPAQTPEFTVQDAERFAELALGCVHREYPSKIAHVMERDAEALPPRQLTPVFYGCFDWHSAVHGHWLLVRLCRTFPKGAFVPKARAALSRSFTLENVAAEVEYLTPKGRHSFERPYGLAWLLQLCAELHEWKDDPEAQHWARVLEPLETIAAERFKTWLPKLSHPIRTGEHSQTAFALGLVLDWARSRNRTDLETLIVERGLQYHQEDQGANLAFEPGGQDFLSPILAEADFLRRLQDPPTFAAWLGRFLPGLPLHPGVPWLEPAVVTDPTDGKLAHLDGLNLSRAWMLEGIAAGLPDQDPRREVLLTAARAHRSAGLAAVTGEHYEGGHWLGSFAVYLVTGRGLARP